MVKKIVIVLFIGAVILGLVLYKNREVRTQNTETSEALSKCEQQMIEDNGKDIISYEGEPKSVDFSLIPEAKTFYTRITEKVDEGPNFAGHYVGVYWGCGTDCYGYAIVNANNGKIVVYSPANPEYHLRSFDLNSNYVVLDPVNAGQERKYFKIKQDGSGQLELVCSEIAKEDMYGLPEQ